jgi:hypothetical protein
MMTVVRRREVAAAVVGVAVLAGPFAGAGPAVAEQAAASTLTYTCPFPSGAQHVTVRITGTFPDSGAVGEAIPVDGVRAAVTLPRAALADVTAVGAHLSLVVKQNETASRPGLAAPVMPLPAGGDLVLDATGPVPPVPVDKAGPVSVAVGDLGLDLSMSTVDGAPADPAILPLACTLDPEQDATLVTIPVPETGASATAQQIPTTPGGGIRVEPIPARPEVPGSRAAAAPIPPECGIIPVPPGGKPGCAFVTGYSNIRKLGASLLVVPALANIAVVPPKVDGVLLKADNPAELVGQRIPPLTGTFLTFGFVPIRATMDLVQVPGAPINIHTEGRRQAPFTFTVTTVAKFSAHIHDVFVNGVRLDVGSNCRTEKPIDMVLTGGTPDYVNVLRGGPQAGFVDIPSFIGCGTTENLDPLLTGTVSGPGNRVKVIQGNVCSPPDQAHTFCPPVAPRLPPPGSF